MARRAKTPLWLAAAREAGRPGTDWLSRALGRAGAVEGAAVEQALAQGRVKVDGRGVRQPFAELAEGARVTVDGHPVSLERRTRVLMLHKPAAVVADGSGRDRRPTVSQVLLPLLDARQRRYVWHAVGRLDVDTTGLLLFSNDERFVEHATSPRSHLPKRYLAQVSERATEAQLQPLRDGVTLDDGPARPAVARLRAKGLVELTLTEGRNHQVKRMLQHVGLPVLRLHREAVGGLTLDLEPGAARELDAREVASLLGSHGEASDDRCAARTR